MILGVCDIFEQRRKALNAQSEEQVVEYTLDHMYEFLDKVHDIGLLVLNQQLKAYEPKDRNWLKMMVNKALQGMMDK
jgi:hypothetical protein